MITRIKFQVRWIAFDPEKKESLHELFLFLIEEYRMILQKIYPYETKGKEELNFSDFIKCHSQTDKMITSVQLILLNLITWTFVLKSSTFNKNDQQRIIKFLQLLKENSFKNPVDREWKSEK